MCLAQEDSSLTRSNQYLLQLFERAGLVVKCNILQRSFPKELFKARAGVHVCVRFVAFWPPPVWMHHFMSYKLST